MILPGDTLQDLLNGWIGANVGQLQHIRFSDGSGGVAIGENALPGVAGQNRAAHASLLTQTERFVIRVEEQLVLEIGPPTEPPSWFSFSAGRGIPLWLLNQLFAAVL